MHSRTASLGRLSSNDPSTTSPTGPVAPLIVPIICSSPILTRGLHQVLAGYASASQGEWPPLHEQGGSALAPKPDLVLVVPQGWQELAAWLPERFDQFRCPWLLLAEPRLVGMFLPWLEARSGTFLPPQTPLSIIDRTLRALANGHRPSLRDNLLGRFAKGASLHVSGWTGRSPTHAELPCGCAVAHGLGNREIAQTLCLSEATVKSHLHQLLRKFDLSNRQELAALFNLALIPLSEDRPTGSSGLSGVSALPPLQLSARPVRLRDTIVLPRGAASLCHDEQQELEDQERIIEQGMQTFWQVGQALKTVRDKRLYRDQHQTFDQYCQTRWGLGRQYAYRMIEGAGVVQDLSPISDTMLPANEAQVRPLTRLKDPEDRRTVWRAVLAEALQTPITAALVRRVVQQYFPHPLCPPPLPMVEPTTLAEAELYILTLARQYAIGPREEKRMLSQRLLAATEYLVQLQAVPQHSDL